MRRITLAVLVPLFLSAPLLLAQDAAQPPSPTAEHHDGTAPRAYARQYRAHAEKDGLSIGADLLSRKEASDTFAADVNRCCLVVLVAVYPKKDQPIELSLSDFSLVEVRSGKPVRPETPTTIAAKLEQKKNPSGGGTDVTTSGGVGYESGTYIDPTTGQPVHVRGVSTQAGVGVTKGSPAPPDVAERDRDVMEWELAEKGLPLDKATVPVAGHLYFQVPKPAKNTKYQLIYTATSEPVILPLQ
jgi:hypothetical protein